MSVIFFATYGCYQKTIMKIYFLPIYICKRLIDLAYQILDKQNILTQIQNAEASTLLTVFCVKIQNLPSHISPLYSIFQNVLDHPVAVLNVGQVINVKYSSHPAQNLTPLYQKHRSHVTVDHRHHVYLSRVRGTFQHISNHVNISCCVLGTSSATE